MILSKVTPNRITLISILLPLLITRDKMEFNESARSKTGKIQFRVQ
jgi:hypothetical protein